MRQVAIDVIAQIQGAAQQAPASTTSASAFQTSSRNRDFLSYIVDALLEGRADRIKAYFIAVDVFGRPESFDPTLDPIVRIEATRLRLKCYHRL
ncbi:hypothetical protein DPM13_00580 [Paracoccus mutanolyticus]|uniref:Uncharacterized protein n=1 Tax=Paracoccus mutanolyticus TaxID=1499308 RepID=A0ABM6WNY6_9RHOB|nr:hypothetical protein [Paracoccus mutanolyticus]AWX92295.1 hypothetical protein DPM13_00580 [Paracoccus mutanolyticus]